VRDDRWHADLDERMNERPSPACGHRVVPHTADVIIEAWGTSRLECLEEAVRALVDSFARVAVAVTKPVPIELDEHADEALLVSLLDEVIYVIDVLGGVPANLALDQTEDGRVVGVIDLAPLSAVEVHGSPPKGVSLNELSISREDEGRWRCRVTIDV
jgi:SHS2 domain-containing protein